MLVLRRRAGEVIVFDGGLNLTVQAIAQHRAWLCFEAPSITNPVVISAFDADDERCLVAVASPTAIEYDEGTISVRTAPKGTAPPEAHVVVPLHLGDRLGLDGISFSLSGLAQNRPTLTIEVACLASPVGFSVHSITGAEARIGIEASDDVRVYRKELWLELLGANQAAAAEWNGGDLDELLITRKD